MTTTGSPKIMYSAPLFQSRHNIADHSAAKDYFMHRLKLGRTPGKLGSSHHKPDPDFMLVPRKAHIKANYADKGLDLPHLPGELILDILELLPPVDALSLRMTCRHIWDLSSTFQSCLRGPQGGDFDEYAWRLRKDCFNRIAEYEETNTISRRYTPFEKLLCSYCTDFHPSSAFGALERECPAIIASERQCTASAGTIYLCPHTQMAFEHFIRLSKRPGTGRSWPACSQGCNTLITSCEESCCFSLTQTIPLYRAGERSPWRTRQHLTPEHRETCCATCLFGSTPFTKIVEAIKDIDIYVCPHVQGTEKVADTLKSMREAPKLGYIGCKHKDHGSQIILKDPERRRWSCKARGCEARLHVVFDKHGVEIRTFRDLSLTKVTAENWRASIQPPVFGTWMG
ncbi:hypothetical protein BKA58DRAFT_421973 [Alternaria rosae]|uniref:uncharacterized protein n=1 Tax=Alternaria rosae TaxID=1187941 RepID=UPI001E8E27E9|nr:uncharacterized protein BKA58DRAFT_421973 [Alternaria rosae]KAH6868744.1 hypothetical protein BKA58DRAFT_421973 [Alternaria rosae]